MPTTQMLLSHCHRIPLGQWALNELMIIMSLNRADYKAELKRLNMSLLWKMVKFFEVAETSEYESAKTLIEEIKTITNNFYYVLGLHKQNIRVVLHCQVL